MRQYNKDFTTIYSDIREAITKEIWDSLKAVPILICRQSNHPEDSYLWLYIAQRGYDEYISGLANTARGGSVGLYENHYMCSFKEAMEILTDKIRDLNAGQKEREEEANAIEYDIVCFDRTLTVYFSNLANFSKEEVINTLDKYYTKWHNVEEIEDEEERRYVHYSCLEEYMVKSTCDELKLALDPARPWTSIYYGPEY